MIHLHHAVRPQHSSILVQKRVSYGADVPNIRTDLRHESDVFTSANHADGADETTEIFRPNPDALVPTHEDDDPSATDGAGPSGGGVYRPPKLTPMSMDEPEGSGRRAAKDAERRGKAARREAASNQFVRDLEAEVMGAPEEVRAEAAGGAAEDSLAMLRERQKLEARARVEEDLMVRT